MSVPSDQANTDIQNISFRTAFQFWLKLGFISFGGSAGQIAIMHEELVERRRWISELRFLHALNYCMLLPGPEAQQLATYIGWLLHGTRGGICAGVLFVLPGLFILILLSWLYVAFGELPLITALFFGIKPAATAIVVHAAWRIGARVLKNPLLWILATLSFAGSVLFSVPFPAIVLAAALIGFAGNRLAPGKFHASHAPHPTAYDDGRAVIGDDSEHPPHTHYSGQRLLRTAGTGIVLWLAPMLALLGTVGWQHTFTQMAWFFTKAALLTFGGAYAVLPYVYQGAVETEGWLTAAQMIDGLALGETTPGPLIMVVTFVGFVGAYANAVLGPDALFLAGVLAAVLVTWFTFLPSFIFILVGGPLIESSRGELHLTAPLTAITAAVVGVIGNLAVFFAFHVLWPNGFPAGFEWRALLLILVALLALFHFKRGVIEVLLGCAAGGLLLTFLG